MAPVVWRTVEEILHRERRQLTGLKEVSAFDAANRSEGPAGAAMVLVLYRSYCSLLAPVDACREIVDG